MLIALDPGNEKTAIVIYGSDGPMDHLILESRDVLAVLTNTYDVCVIEMIASYGMAVGAEVFETCVWIGRFMQEAISHGTPVRRIFRKDVKLNLCGQTKAKDANIRQALIDRFGGPASIKKGGPLYKIKADEWAALAVAVTYCDQQKAGLHA